jgi:non-ribosomal peptide synthetase-like protein
MTALYALASALLPALLALALLPGLVVLDVLDVRVGAWALLATPLAAASFVALLCAAITLLKVALGRERAGCYDVWSVPAFRRWLNDRAMAVSLDSIGGLYATLLLGPWYRALGAHVGKNAEISSASALAPDLVDVGDEAFIADCVALGPPRVERGVLHLEATRVGARAFVGNSALVPAGSDVEDDTLIGCLSRAPRESHRGTSWLGSPPTPLPQREASAAFPASATYRPTRALAAQRYAIEALRIVLPPAILLAVARLLVDVEVELWSRAPAAGLVLLPIAYLALAASAAVVVVAAKWLTVGRYRAGARPLWSAFVWRTELVTALHENVADPLFNQLFLGTPFVAWFFRALGATIGRRVYVGTTQLTEYDLVRVGDDACLDTDATLQTHLFEDRVMKVSRVDVRERCSVGARSIVLYDSTMEPASRLEALSLLMKGESLPEGTAWVGSPARRAS